MYQLALLKIPVSDVARALPFYRDALGFSEVFVVAEYGWAQLTAGDLPLALYVPGMGGGDRAPGGEVDFHLAVPDLEAWCAAAVGRGASCPAGVERGDDGSAFCVVVDPDGNRLRIMALAEGEG